MGTPKDSLSVLFDLKLLNFLSGCAYPQDTIKLNTKKILKLIRLFPIKTPLPLISEDDIQALSTHLSMSRRNILTAPLYALEQAYVRSPLFLTSSLMQKIRLYQQAIKQECIKRNIALIDRIFHQALRKGKTIKAGLYTGSFYPIAFYLSPKHTITYFCGIKKYTGSFKQVQKIYEQHIGKPASKKPVALIQIIPKRKPQE